MFVSKESIVEIQKALNRNSICFRHGRRGGQFFKFISIACQFFLLSLQNKCAFKQNLRKLQIACELICCHMPQPFSILSPGLESRILIRIRQKLYDTTVKSILPRILESWIAVISLVFDLTLAVSWVGTVSCSILRVSARPARADQGLS